MFAGHLFISEEISIHAVHTPVHCFLKEEHMVFTLVVIVYVSARPLCLLQGLRFSLLPSTESRLPASGFQLPASGCVLPPSVSFSTPFHVFLCSFLVVFCETGSHDSLGWLGVCYVDQAILKLRCACCRRSKGACHQVPLFSFSSFAHAENGVLPECASPRHSVPLFKTRGLNYIVLNRVSFTLTICSKLRDIF